MWNYRLVRRTHPDGTRTYAVHEAHYDEAGGVWAITAEPVEVFGETWQEARRCLAAMEHAFRAPVLPWESVPEEGAEAPWRRRPDRSRRAAKAARRGARRPRRRGATRGTDS